ncbi:AmmeMemoRadiSam system radical SAM enzyme [Eubacteriaceae bacterium ES2]|nr:AmmeMemoRadiSam system radical SAM enzyme [Eubacteriaceae bacterium ES2]
MEKIRCRGCFRHCLLGEGQFGFCNGRANIKGQIVPVNYGMVTAIALDPIEKKPLKNFQPGSKVLSIGSFGCNLRCPFCQNYEISMAKLEEANFRKMTPQDVADNALRLKEAGNIGVAYTYNEPLIGWEFVKDCATEVKGLGMKNVLVTNGCFEAEIIEEVIPFIDAVNIDLKGFNQNFYGSIGGDLESVKRSIALFSASVHVEVTTLLIPGANDSLEEIKRLTAWLASVDKKIPYHLTRFFPQYHMQECDPTDIKEMRELAEIAGQQLETVYLGNC